MQDNERIGEVFTSNEGCKFIIVEYNKYNDVWIEFCDEHKARVHTGYGACKKGEIKNPYHPSVYGHGYLGLMSDGTRPKTMNGNGKHTREYTVWKSMIQRVYCLKFHERCPTYKDVVLEDCLHCFAFFLEHVIRNIPNYEYWLNHPNELVALDKDTKSDGSKTYSRDTLMFIPQSENCKERNERCGIAIKPIKVYGVNVKTGERTKVFNSTHEASRELGVNQSSISACLNGRLKSTGGYRWFKVEDEERGDSDND